MPLKIPCKSVLVYVLYTILLILTNALLPNVPLTCGAMFAFLLCGADLIAAPLLYIAASAVSLHWITSALTVFEGAFLCAVTFLYRRHGKKMKWEAVLYLLFALLPFVFLSPWQGIEGINLPLSPYLPRALAVLFCLVYGFFALKGIYCCLYKLYRCLPQEDELLSLAVLYTLGGAGLYRLCGDAVLLALSVFLAIWAIRLFRSPAAIAVCAVCGFAESLAKLSLQPITFLVVAGLCALLFCRVGRWAPSVVFLPFTALYAYQNDLFSCAVYLLVLRALLLLLACVAPILFSESYLLKSKQRLLVKPLLPARAGELLRERTGERLFLIADVFREIEQAFTAMDEGVNEAGAKARVFAELKERNCKTCERRDMCEKTEVYNGFLKLVNTGCVKGKVSVIDLPSEVTLNCAHPADVIAKLNVFLAEYRRYMTEAENARAGRMLLAEQARGIENVMKLLAVELCHVPNDNTELCERLQKALAKQGITCSEVEITGESNLQITLIASGDAPLPKLQKALCEVCRKNFLLKEKTPYDGTKTCYVFVVPCRLDAAFGVAFAVKNGENVSGDTHSVIRINEHQFLATLSDGMGSGDYAQKISATAISLIEAFYRAQMPRDAVLDTINKLLSYRRDERFTCLDIAAIDLNTGEAEFVKIGAPVGVIVRGKECVVLEGEGLPLGILESVKPTILHETLKNGDILVFMSDGITSAFHSAPDLCEYLQTLNPLNPQNLADRILAEGLERTHGVAEDDMTVLCVRIFEPTD